MTCHSFKFSRRVTQKGLFTQLFIKKLPIENITYIHMAGHLRVGDNLIIDTHGEPIIDKVYDLFNYTTKLSNPVPVL